MRLEPFADEHLPVLDALIADPVSLRFTRIPDHFKDVRRTDAALWSRLAADPDGGS